MDKMFYNVNQEAIKALKLRQQKNQSTLPSKAPFKTGTGKKITQKKKSDINNEAHRSPVKGTKSPARSRGASKSPPRQLQGSPAERFKVTSEYERCEMHPGEELQFYSFVDNKALCSTCLLKGPYAGTETLNLRKASEILKHKITDLVIEMHGKIDLYDLYGKKLVNRKEELGNLTSGYKREVSATINQLIKKLQDKERELIEEVEAIEKEKIAELEAAGGKLEAHEKKVKSKKKELESCVKNLNDLDLCSYYSKQTKSIEECLLDDFNQELEEAKAKAEMNINLERKINTEDFKQYFRSINQRLESISVLETSSDFREQLSDRGGAGQENGYGSRQMSPLKQALNRSGSGGRFHNEEAINQARRKLIERYYPISLVGATSLYSPKRLHGSHSSASSKDFRLREKQANISDIFENGYHKIRDLKAKSPAYRHSPVMKLREEHHQSISGMSGLMNSISSNKRPLGALESRLMTPKTEANFSRSFGGGQRYSTKENNRSRNESPQKEFDMIRASIRDKIFSKY